MRTLTILFALLLALVPAAIAQDFNEQFDYTAGSSLSGQGGWVVRAGSGTVTVVAGSLTYAGYSREVGNKIELTAPTPTDIRSAGNVLPAAITTGDLYVSFLVHYTQQPASLTRILAAANEGNGNLPLRIRAGASGDGVAIGVRKNEGATAAAAQVLNLNETYLIVARYRYGGGAGDDEVALWVNPSPLPGNDTPPPPDVTSTDGSDAAALTGLRVRQNLGVGRLEVDDLRAATSYAELDPTLPVEIESFAGTIDDGTVQLRWRTAAETGAAGFGIAVAAGDAADWQEVGFVPALGVGHGYAFAYAVPGPGVYRFRLLPTDLDGSVTAGPEVAVEADVAGDYWLLPAYPNPFNPSTTIRFAVREAQDVRVDVLDALGRRVQTLFSGRAAAGETYDVRFEASGLPSGLYLYRIQGDDFSATRQMLLVR